MTTSEAELRRRVEELEKRVRLLLRHVEELEAALGQRGVVVKHNEPRERSRKAVTW